MCQPRSGSTLLRYILDSHPKIVCPAELSLGELCNGLYRLRLLNANPEQPRWNSAVIANVRALIDDEMERYMRARQKTLWCDKSPSNLQRFEILTEVFPDGRFILLYRQCLDVVLSTIQFYNFTFSPLVDGSFGDHAGDRPQIEKWMDSWCNAVELMLRYEAILGSRCHPMRYEDLVTNPEPSLRTMFSFLELEMDPSLVRTAFKERHDAGTGDVKIRFTERIHTNSVGNGRSLMWRNAAPALVSRMTQLSERLGYRLEDQQPDSSNQRHENDAGLDPEMVTLHFSNVLASRTSLQSESDPTCIVATSDSGRNSWIADLGALTFKRMQEECPARCKFVLRSGDLVRVIHRQDNALDLFLKGQVSIEGDVRFAHVAGMMLFSEQA